MPIQHSENLNFGPFSTTNITPRDYYEKRGGKGKTNLEAQNPIVTETYGSIFLENVTRDTNRDLNKSVFEKLHNFLETSDFNMYKLSEDEAVYYRNLNLDCMKYLVKQKLLEQFDKFVESHRHYNHKEGIYIYFGGCTSAWPEEKKALEARIDSDFDKLKRIMLNLNDNAYDEYFERIFGFNPRRVDPTLLAENRNYSPPSIEKLEAVMTSIKNSLNAGIRENVPGYMQTGVEKQQQRVSECKTEARNLGCYDWTIFHACSFLLYGKATINGLFAADEKDIAELQTYLNNGDTDKFNEKYRYMTGVDFDIQNIQKMEEAVDRLGNVQLLRYMGKDIEELKLHLQMLNQPGMKIGYIIKSLESQKQDYYSSWASPLEQALYKQFGGRENHEEADRNTRIWLHEKITALKLDNESNPIETYKTLLKEYIREYENMRNKFPDYNSRKYDLEAEEATNKALGKCIAKDKLKTTLWAVNGVKFLIDSVILTAGGIAGGWWLLAASAVPNIGEFINNRTDGTPSSWAEDITKLAVGTLTTYAGCKAGEAILKEASKFIANNLLAKCTARTISSAADGGTNVCGNIILEVAINGTNPNPEIIETITTSEISEFLSNPPIEKCIRFLAMVAKGHFKIKTA